MLSPCRLPFVLAFYVFCLPLTQGQQGAFHPIQSGGDTAQIAGSNLLLNGGLEIYSGGVCDYDLPNSIFSLHMAHATAFGPAEEIDVFTVDPTCPGHALEGVRLVYLRRQPDGDSDTFSMALAAPLVSGNADNLQFYGMAANAAQFGYGRIQIGLSQSPTEFGVLVHEVDVPTSNPLTGPWWNFAASFVAPMAANFITVSEARIGAWTALDGFLLREATLGLEYCLAPTNKTGYPSDIEASGSASTSAGDLILTAQPVSNQPGIFYHGSTSHFYPFGCGFKCVGGAIARGVVVGGMGHIATYAYDNSTTKHSLAPYVGNTRYFQYWYRDPDTMGCSGQNFTLSNAIAIMVLP